MPPGAPPNPRFADAMARLKELDAELEETRRKYGTDKLYAAGAQKPKDMGDAIMADLQAKLGSELKLRKKASPAARSPVKRGRVGNEARRARIEAMRARIAAAKQARGDNDGGGGNGGGAGSGITAEAAGFNEGGSGKEGSAWAAGVINRGKKADGGAAANGGHGHSHGGEPCDGHGHGHGHGGGGDTVADLPPSASGTNGWKVKLEVFVAALLASTAIALTTQSTYAAKASFLVLWGALYVNRARRWRAPATVVVSLVAMLIITLFADFWP